MNLSAQVDQNQGVLTFMTSENFYVKFDSTKDIEIGDTLWYSTDNLIPVLKVFKKSSTSCICLKISEKEIGLDQTFLHFKKQVLEKPTLTALSDSLRTNNQTETYEDNSLQDELILDPEFKQNIRGRISFSSYSNLSSVEGEGNHRTLSRFSINAKNIDNSKFSLESYLNYRQNFVEQNRENSIETKFFRIFNLALSYQHDSTLVFSIGRKINRNISSIGAIDGLQGEKRIGKYFFVGGVLGYKPDIAEFGLNFNLLEYGTYIGLEKKFSSNYNRATFGVMEQMNAGNTDRRYLYFQSINNLGRKFSVFSSSEIDLYSRINSITKNEIRLTNLLLSLRYRFSRKLTLSISYDNRKRIIYYETLRTEVERLLEDDEARQGVRARIGFRPFKFLSGGINYSKRFQNGESNKSDNINAYFNFSKIPIIEGSFSIRFNRNISNYLVSEVYSIRYSNSIFKNKLYGQIYYRLAKYDYISNENINKQAFYGLNLYYRVTKRLRFGILGEMTVREDYNTYRINTKLSQRF